MDEGTGLTYFGARFYDGETGRFTTLDTHTNLPNDERILLNLYNDDDERDNQIDQILSIGLDNPQSYNQYTYCLDNPIDRQDLDGHDGIGQAIAELGESLEGAGPYGAAVGEALMGIGFVVTAIAGVQQANQVNSQHGVNNGKHGWLQGKSPEELNEMYNDPKYTAKQKQAIKQQQKNIQSRKSRHKDHQKASKKGKSNNGKNTNNGNDDQNVNTSNNSQSSNGQNSNDSNGSGS